MAPIFPNHKGPKFVLKRWYSREEAKKELGKICRTVYENGTRTTMAGSEEEPYTIIEDIDEVEIDKEVIHKSIDEVRSDFSNIVNAVNFYGTIFVIDRKAAMYANPKSQHPALKYKRASSSSEEVKKIVNLLEDALKEARGLNSDLLSDFKSLVEKLSDKFARINEANSLELSL